MKVRTVITATLATILLLAPTTLVAQGYGGGFGGHGGGGFGEGGAGLLERFSRLADRLDLSDEQRAAIATILEKELPPIREMMEQARAGREAFHENHSMGDFDEGEYRYFFEEQARIGVEIHLATASTWSQIFVLLTPEQQELVSQMRSRAGRGYGEGFGRRSGGHRSK
jgi:Spy/CpxP family protein refolding chaperone